MKYKLLDSCRLSISASEGDHPNKMKFEGVLVRLDEPSTKPPNGARGHKILIPTTLAKKQLHTLIGMGVNYSDGLTSHAPTHKVGVIEKAWIEGKNLYISGIIWKKDFPEAPEDLSKANLGMSFEASDIQVEDEKADIWVISKLCFTGATILYKASAAYYNTSADAMAASAEELLPAKLVRIESWRKQMAKNNNTQRVGKKIAAGSDDALVLAFGKALAPLVAEIKTNTSQLKAMQASFEELTVNASDEEDDDTIDVNADGESTVEDSMTSKKLKAAKKKKADTGNEDDENDDEDNEDDEDDIDSEADDEDELDDLGDDDGDAEELGKMNEDANINKGRSVPSKGAGKSGKVDASALTTIAKLQASNEQQARVIRRLEKQVKDSRQQLSAAADRVDRRSVSVSTVLAATLGKGNIDIQAMSNAGEKLTVSEFDAVLASSNVDSVTAISMKNEMVRSGLMESGEVTRR